MDRMGQIDMLRQGEKWSDDPIAEHRYGYGYIYSVREGSGFVFQPRCMGLSGFVQTWIFGSIPSAIDGLSTKCAECVNCLNGMGDNDEGMPAGCWINNPQPETERQRQKFGEGAESEKIKEIWKQAEEQIAVIQMQVDKLREQIEEVKRVATAEIDALHPQIEIREGSTPVVHFDEGRRVFDCHICYK